MGGRFFLTERYGSSMDEAQAERAVRQAFADDAARAVAWDFAKELGKNHATAGSELRKATLAAVLLAAFFELLQLGAVSETAKFGPFEISQTTEVQVLAPVLVSYFAYIAACCRSLINANVNAFALVMKTAFPTIYASNLDQVVLPPAVDMQGFSNFIQNRTSRAGRWDAILGLVLAGAVFFGGLAFAVLAFAQIIVAGARWWIVAPAVVVTAFFVARSLLVVDAHSGDAHAYLTPVQ